MPALLAVAAATWQIWPRSEPQDLALREHARLLEDQGRLAEAVQAYEQLVHRYPQEPDPLVDLAVALAKARPQGLRGTPERMLEQALKLAPGHRQALALLGTAAFDDTDYAQAAARWSELLRSLPPNDAMAGDIQARLQQAETLALQDDTRRGAARTAATSTFEPQHP